MFRLCTLGCDTHNDCKILNHFQDRGENGWKCDGKLDIIWPNIIKGKCVPKCPKDGGICQSDEHCGLWLAFGYKTFFFLMILL